MSTLQLVTAGVQLPFDRRVPVGLPCDERGIRRRGLVWGGHFSTAAQRLGIVRDPMAKIA
ncbi:hypothetical protein [Arthrobacter castelli]|uniref:hypothetical protein n=1 Tax=Arthrobacter castelli TaxID=271431 RepID=UPI0012DCB49C|nr:hypothetical protein [Arthrobacter castelli]